MGKAEPIGSVGEERVVKVGVEESGVNSCNPQHDGVGEDGTGFEEGCQPRGFLLEREGGEAAEDEAEDEEGEPKAEGAEQLRLSLGGRGHVWAMVAHCDFEKVEGGGLIRGAKMWRNILNTW